MIEVNNLTKIFFNGRGIFDVSFNVKEGEVFGFLGPNGAGKSTTIRHLLGFSRPMNGYAKIGGYDCWLEAGAVHRLLGYIPGEIAFLDNISAIDFLNLMSGMRGVKNKHKERELIEQFQLDIKTPINRMSKGMKQKLAIISALCHDPQVIILDEPSTGLDPLMQKIFIEKIIEEKNKGKTILISSHIFSEVEDTVDTVCIIKQGKILQNENIDLLKKKMLKRVIEVTLDSEEETARILSTPLKIIEHNENKVKIAPEEDMNLTLKTLSSFKVKDIETIKIDLEDMFMHFYHAEEV